MNKIIKFALFVFTGIALAVVIGVFALGAASDTASESAVAPLPVTGPKPEFGDWFVFNPDEVGHWPVDANGAPLEVGGSMPFRIADSDYVLGTVKRVPAGTPLIYALNDRIVVQLYGSSTPDCQPRIKSAIWGSSQQLAIVVDDLFEDTLGCDSDLSPKAFDLFPTQYADNEYWRDPNQVARFLAQIPNRDNFLVWTSKMDYSENPEGVANEFGSLSVAYSIAHKIGAAAEDYDGDMTTLTSIETNGVDAVSDDGGHIVCRFGQPCVSVDQFGNETVLEIAQGICNDEGCETLPAFD